MGSGNLDEPREGPLFLLCPQTLPIHELLRHTNLGPLEAKRRNLERALDQYLMEFSACRCGPCFNNGVPILSGTSCKCQCPLGRKGLACEQMEQEGKTRASSLSSRRPRQGGQCLWGSGSLLLCPRAHRPKNAHAELY